MINKRDFFKVFFSSRKMTGSITPSSRFLTHKMLRPINFNKTNCIIELGPGTGVFTKEIIKRLKPDATLFVFELNDVFAGNLKDNITDPRVRIIHDSAENIQKYIKEEGIDKVDCIISSLPLTAIPQEIRTDILTTCHESLKNAGLFIQFQYSLHQIKPLKVLYKKVKVDYALLNIPPAFVYICKK
jgi:phosphatidylethanolamine/phosphatidyl-N-methylethanolamine N-methyltransferase